MFRAGWSSTLDPQPTILLHYLTVQKSGSYSPIHSQQRAVSSTLRGSMTVKDSSFIPTNHACFLIAKNYFFPLPS